MISRHNKIIHGMWFGKTLSRLELLTIRSFVRCGHDFHLWAYDDLSAFEFPRGVVVRDAEEIIRRNKVFAKSDIDAETGVGRNSIGAPFSDLFRYKLLSEHGGIWVDMDVTCLRPFDFADDYVFRPHRIGVVGSILKCPKGSRLMRDVYDETLSTVDAQSDYLAPNRILTKHVEQAGLASSIVENISNPDHWMEYIRPLIEGRGAISDEWYAIHWINEMWRTLDVDGGRYRGRDLLGYVPDKDAPRPGSTLWELYRKHGLIDSRAAGAPGTAARRPGDKKTVPIRGLRDRPRTPGHLNMLLPSLVRGGAERAVLETMSALRGVSGLTQRLYVVHRSRLQYPPNAGDNLSIVFADDGRDAAGSLRAFAMDMLQASSPVVYCHLIPTDELRRLWGMGVSTIPVVQNMSPGWTNAPADFADDHVPFVVGVSDAVSDELRTLGCPKPVITLRHELQRVFAPSELARQRREIRDRHGIADHTLLIGMVGQFKSQKAYTRAVRVLHGVRQFLGAKLMILGGWDHEYGAGRAAYEATCRRAVELGVIADTIMPGDVHPVDPYLAAFDVFLNTSIYEGLSVALLEAIQAGCPIVTADAGGNGEVLPTNAVLVSPGADIEAYVQGVLKLAAVQERAVPFPPPQPTLVPQLWALIAKHGVANSLPRRSAQSGTLFLTQNLQVGGPQRSLINLLSRLPRDEVSAVCMVEGPPSAANKLALDQAQIPLLSADEASTLVDAAEFVIDWADRLNVRNICFWNVGPELKLTIAKILATRRVRLIDVSPGPMLFDELDACAPFQRRLSFTSKQYFQRLYAFVSKYDDDSGRLAQAFDDPAKVRVIRNGVARPPSFVPLPPAEAMRPPQFDGGFSIGTCCRLVPDKRIEFLLDMMAIVGANSPRATLTIVGGPDRQSADYFTQLQARVRDEALDNVLFVGEVDDVRAFLGQFDVFVMVSDRQGCPNASLEAMAMGLPVVAVPSGGVAEQVRDGLNGYLVESPQEMAERVLALEKNKRLRRKMGKAAAAIAVGEFSLEGMVDGYRRLLGEAVG